MRDCLTTSWAGCFYQLGSESTMRCRGGGGARCCASHRAGQHPLLLFEAAIRVAAQENYEGRGTWCQRSVHQFEVQCNSSTGFYVIKG